MVDLPSSSTACSSESELSNGGMIEKPPDIHLLCERASTRRHFSRETEKMGSTDNLKHGLGGEGVGIGLVDEGLPNGGYGWVCVGCVFWINVCTWGISSVSFIFSSGDTSKSSLRTEVGQETDTCRLMEYFSLITSRPILSLARQHFNTRS
jgi:hypothetical protein